MGTAGKPLGLIPGERTLKAVMQVFLVLLDRQHVVRSLLSDLLGDGFLTPPPTGFPIRRHNAIFQLQHL